MTIDELEYVEQLWPDLAPWLFVPHIELAYLRLVAVLDALIDRVGEAQSHPLASLMEVVGTLIDQYESANVAELT